MNPDPRPRSVYEQALRKLAERDRVFADIQRGPNPLTPEQIRKLAARYPERWRRYLPG